MVIKGVSLRGWIWRVLCLLGPNGSGKSTLFKAILGFLPLKKGEILLGEKTSSRCQGLILPNQ